MENEKLEEVKTEEVKEEKISIGALDKVMSFFTPKEKEEVKEDDEKEINVDELVDAKVAEKLQEIMPKVKKEKENELNTKKEELEQRENEMEIQKSLENVQDSFKEFVKFQAEQTGVSIDDFLNDNKQYMKDEKIKQTTFQQSKVTGVELSEKDAQIYHAYESAGIFNKEEN